MRVESSSLPAFAPPSWLRNPHVQTILGSQLPRRLSYGWRSWEPVEIELGTGQGRLMAEASWQPGPRSARPAVLFWHGLEGSAQSRYVVAMSKKAFARGFHAVRINMRNCGGTEHLTPTLYCAALSGDIEATVRRIRQLGCRDILAAGVSLGASMLLKFLGEQASRGPEHLRAAAVMSPPIDLRQGVDRLEHPGNRIYQRHFVRHLVRRMKRKSALFPGVCDLQRLGRVRTIYEFDDLVTAPHFGFGTAADYYRLASTAPLLGAISVPTLIVQAMDDPMIPFDTFRTAGIENNPHLRLLATTHGGHAGFIQPRRGSEPDGHWGENRIIGFLASLL